MTVNENDLVFVMDGDEVIFQSGHVVVIKCRRNHKTVFKFQSLIDGWAIGFESSEMVALYWTISKHIGAAADRKPKHFE